MPDAPQRTERGGPRGAMLLASIVSDQAARGSEAEGRLSPLTRQMWLDAWGHLESARLSFDEAKTDDDRKRALVDMVFLGETLTAACMSFVKAIGYDEEEETP